MAYTINDFVNHKSRILIDGKMAIAQRNLEKLTEIISNPDFDSTSYEARALLFEAAQKVYLDAFIALGDANVCLCDNNTASILNQRPHTLLGSFPYGRKVIMTYEGTPLHTLLKNINLTCLEKINLGLHFGQQDIEQALDTYSIKEQGTPLDIAYKHHRKTLDFLSKQPITGQEYTNAAILFPLFCQEMLAYNPDLTAPEMGRQNMLHQKAISDEDGYTLATVAEWSIALLNNLGYKYQETEYLCLFYNCSDAELLNEMQTVSGYKKPTVIEEAPKPTLLQKIGKLLKVKSRD